MLGITILILVFAAGIGVCAWTDALEAEVRSHLAYMVVDMPVAEREAVAVDDALAARLAELVRTRGPEAAGPLLPPACGRLQVAACCRSSAPAPIRLWPLRAMTLVPAIAAAAVRA